MIKSKDVLKHIIKQDKIYRKWIEEIESVLFQKFYELFGNKYKKDLMWVEVREITFDYLYVFAENDKYPYITFKISYGILKESDSDKLPDVVFQDTVEVFSPSKEEDFFESISMDFLESVQLHL